MILLNLKIWILRNSRIRKGFSLLLVPFFFLTSGAVSRAQSLQWVGNVAEGVLSVHGTADGHVLLNKGHVVELLDMASEKIR